MCTRIEFDFVSVVTTDVGRKASEQLSNVLFGFVFDSRIKNETVPTLTAMFSNM